MIEIIPAIDLSAGQVVRLFKGDFASSTVYAADPVACAQGFADLGFCRLHLVDLDGARTGKPQHLAVLEAICRTTKLAVDFGGGLRNPKDIEAVLAAGAKQVNLGSMALKDPELFQSCLKHFGPAAIILCADFKDQYLVSQGWQEQSKDLLIPFLEKHLQLGVQQVLCTDVSRDGTLSGPALKLYQQIQNTLPNLRLIASGGLSCLADIEALDQSGIAAVVLGKAWYEGRITPLQLRPYL